MMNGAVVAYLVVLFVLGVIGWFSRDIAAWWAKRGEQR